MSQMHSHGPGQPMHSHGPSQPQQGQQVQLTPQQVQQLQQLQAQQQQQRMMQQQQPDPAVQAAIDANFQEIKFKLGQPNNNVLLCENHGRQKCEECTVDFIAVNELAARISSLPSAIPPPPQMANNQIAQLVGKAKEEGNNHYKNNKYEQAIQAYSVALRLSANRNPWDPSSTTREEMSISLSNRSAAYMGLGDPTRALVDADLAISLRRAWFKGHLRRGRALLALSQPYEAKKAVVLGLSFEPENAELLTLSSEVDAAIAKAKGEMLFDKSG